MKVYNEENQEVTEYIGQYYDGQHLPQSLYVQIEDGQEPFIDYREMGVGVPPEVWYNRAIRLDLPSYAYSYEQAEMILKSISKDVKAITDSYYEHDDTQLNCHGRWDRNLIEYLQEKLGSYTSDLWFDDEHIMDVEETIIGI